MLAIIHRLPSIYRGDVARGGEKRSLGVRAHLWRIWRRLVEKQISASTIFGKENLLAKKKPEDEEYDNPENRI